ncbi:response regulator [Oleiharenicola lentus]|uniref:response regulator n=1 Tax=Oleiharenicola lentus TaxID=2508720 RepID=UPI003F672970
MKPAATLLLVDDLPAGLASLTDFLTQAGYEVLMAENGKRALHLAQLARPDLILLDLVMPELDGFGVLAHLKANAELSAIPVLVISSQSDIGERLRAFAAGALDYVAKPFFPEEVLARVQTHLRLRALTHALAENNRQLAAEIQLRHEAEAQLQQSLDRAVALVAPDGRLLLCTLLARRLLNSFFSDVPAETLPPSLAQWVAARRTQTPDTAEIFRIASAVGEFTAQLFADPWSGDSVMLLLDQQRPGSPAALERLGLSPREAEVLYWLAEGKSYKEIAVILACESRTAQKHAERIFEKLGVENRHAAALVAQQALAGSSR